MEFKKINFKLTSKFINKKDTDKYPNAKHLTAFPQPKTPLIQHNREENFGVICQIKVAMNMPRFCS